MNRAHLAESPLPRRTNQRFLQRSLDQNLPNQASEDRQTVYLIESLDPRTQDGPRTRTQDPLPVLHIHGRRQFGVGVADPGSGRPHRATQVIGPRSVVVVSDPVIVKRILTSSPVGGATSGCNVGDGAVAADRRLELRLRGWFDDV